MLPIISTFLDSICMPSEHTNVALESAWRKRYLDRLKESIIPSEDGKWGRLILAWNEKRGEGLLSHIYAPCIDLEEWNGLYIDDRPLQIYAKIMLQCVCRPFHLIAKTLYHVSMVQVFYEIIQTVRKRQSLKTCVVHSLRSIADIVRTPLLGLASLVCSVALLLFSPLHPEWLYAGRRCLGKIESLANWGIKHSPWILGRCFQPLEFSFLYVYEEKVLEDTLYPSDDALDRQLTNFTRSAIHYKQTHIDITSCQKASFHEPYHSSIPFIV